MPADDNVWVLNFLPRLRESLGRAQLLGVECRVNQGSRLAASCEVTEYEGTRPRRQILPAYLADLLVVDVRARERWVPRVLLECRSRPVAANMVLNHDMKAEAHKAVHPYLRVGLLLGRTRGAALPGRVLRHGTHLDFILSWHNLEPDAREWDRLTRVLCEEVHASRRLEEILKGRTTMNTRPVTGLWRRLEFDHPVPEGEGYGEE